MGRSAQRVLHWHWLSNCILLILKKTKKRLHVTESKRNGKTHHACLCRWPCIPNLGAIASIIIEWYQGIVLERIPTPSISCKILVKRKQIIKLNSIMRCSNEEESQGERLSKRVKRQHVYLHVFVVLYWELRWVSDKVDFWDNKKSDK